MLRWVKFYAIGILMLFFLLLIGSSCQKLRYSKYHADWIITQFAVDGIDSMEIVGVYNFKLDLDRRLASPIGLYIEGQQFMLREQASFNVHTKNQIDYIYFQGHPFFQGEYQISCLDEMCCELVMKSDLIYMRFVYNGDIPYGKTRPCD